MPHPVIAEVYRGNRLESIHRGSFIVVDAYGDVVCEGGDPQAPVFARSALKLMQALPLVESGAADALGFGDRQLAMACASHSSSPDHIQTVEAMLAKAGLGEAHLQCGAHWPLYKQKDVVDMVISGERPTRLHNNCSGKHAGFLCTCAHIGEDPARYIDRESAVQREVMVTISALTGHDVSSDAAAIDGCSAPTFAVPLKGFAHAIAKLATGVSLEPVRTAAGRRLITANMAQPYFVAGRDRFCTQIMEAGQGAVYAKIGAEGVYLAALPQLGLGIALKCDDGAERAAEVFLAALVSSVLPKGDALTATIQALARRDITDFNKNTVGELRGIAPISPA